MLKIQTTKSKLIAAMITMMIVLVATFTFKNYQQETVLSNILFSTSLFYRRKTGEPADQKIL